MGTNLFLYRVVFETTQLRDFPLTKAWNPTGAPYGLGLMAKKRLPDVSSFGNRLFIYFPMRIISPAVEKSIVHSTTEKKKKTWFI